MLRNITKSFSGFFEPIINDLSLTLEAGEFCVIVGANGSGKSTLMKIINKEHVPDAGTLVCSGQIAQVVQDVNQGIIPSMSLLENLALSQMRYKRPKLRFYRRYLEDILLEIKALGMGLEKYLHQPMKFLSGGQKQVIATVMAMHSGSQLLLLDEHTSALDPNMQNLLMQYSAAEIAKQNLTTLMITHKMDDAIQYGHRLVMLHKGKIVLDIRGDEKKSLNAQDLLAYFHKYEDKNLLSQEVCYVS